MSSEWKEEEPNVSKTARSSMPSAASNRGGRAHLVA